MNAFLLAGIWDVDFLFAVPLIVAVSLVFAATRHERMELIFAHAFRVGVWIVGFMLVVAAVVKLITWLL